jgi:hypothetical protein
MKHVFSVYVLNSCVRFANNQHHEQTRLLLYSHSQFVVCIIWHLQEFHPALKVITSGSRHEYPLKLSDVENVVI